MGMRVKFDVGAMTARIENLAQLASTNASRTMRRAAIRIRDLAISYAPVDTGALEGAIDYGVNKEGRRNTFVVFIDLRKIGNGGKPIEDYAWIMETQLHPFGRRAPGAKYFKVRAASAAKGSKVGGRFLDRAIDEGIKDIVDDVRKEVSRTFGGRQSVHSDE